MERSKLPCRYFSMGFCKSGDNCDFVHVAGSSSKGESRICSYFSAGNCLKGDDCRFKHEPPRVAAPVQLNKNQNTLASTFQTLGGSSSISSESTAIDPSWANAPEFVPRFSTTEPRIASNSAWEPLYTENNLNIQSSNFSYPPLSDCDENGQMSSAQKSWADVANAGIRQDANLRMETLSVADAESQLCPYGAIGSCRYELKCTYVHGDVCDMCGCAVLHPQHKEQRKSHEKSCMKQHEEQMELAFAVAKSKDKTCGICMEVIMDKRPKGEARFGILPNCTHCFCLSCLRKWRQSNFENRIIRSCPECRQTSDFICPSKFWVDKTDEKEKLLNAYKTALNEKECKYYKNGEGECPFGNKCFYKHVDSRGNLVDVGPPQRKPRRENADGELSLEEELFFFDFIREREEREDEFHILEVMEILSIRDSDIEFIL